jgi:Fic family protein
MIVSNDSIMKPPYEITNRILQLLTAISEQLGEVSAHHLHKPSPELRRRNRVKTIKASLEIEGNTLSEDQITAIIDKKRIVGPKQDISTSTASRDLKYGVENKIIFRDGDKRTAVYQIMTRN